MGEQQQKIYDEIARTEQNIVSCLVTKMPLEVLERDTDNMPTKLNGGKILKVDVDVLGVLSALFCVVTESRFPQENSSLHLHEELLELRQALRVAQAQRKCGRGMDILSTHQHITHTPWEWERGNYTQRLEVTLELAA